MYAHSLPTIIYPDLNKTGKSNSHLIGLAKIVDSSDGSLPRCQAAVVVSNVVDVVAVTAGRTDVVVARPVLLHRVQRGHRDLFLVDVL